MKILPVVLFASILTTVPAISAEEKATAPIEKSSPADKDWAEIAEMLAGPKVRPKSQEEAKKIFKEHIMAMDEKGAAFLKAHPNDPRRWRLVISEAETNSVRGMIGLTPKNEADIKKKLAEVIAAPDADKETKATASFGQVMMAAENEVEYRKLAEAHLAAYPAYPGNEQIKEQLKEQAAGAELKSKPLDIKFTATNGSEVDLSKMTGKVVLLDFWATWCGPCMAEVPNVVKTYEKLHGKGFEIVGISFDQDKAKLEKITKDKSMSWPQYFDGKEWKNEFGQKFGINSIPRMWLVNKKGMLVDTNGREGLEAKVEKLLAE
jgi:thiol-disulfide isomerase/thioredoxin